MSDRFVAYGDVCFLSEGHATLHRSAEIDRPTSTAVCENCGKIFPPKRWSWLPSTPPPYITINFEADLSILDAECKKENKE